MKPLHYLLLGITITALTIILLGLIMYYFFSWHLVQYSFWKPGDSLPTQTEDSYNLSSYTFPALSETQFIPKTITFNQDAQVINGLREQTFSYQFEDYTISGNFIRPDNNDTLPIIIMIRGYAEPDNYFSGYGSHNAARAYAAQGYATFAPDFLGFAASDPPPNNVWYERFSKPAQIIQLIASLKNVDNIDTSRLGLWGHSNGGQISISVLEITGQPYPTALWAPVTKPFPYNILYFTDYYDDHGMALRASLAALEWDHNVREYSISNYLENIHAPIILHQGTADPDVPVTWSRDFVNSLEPYHTDITYHEYSGSDHNLRPAWQTVVDRDIQFYNSHLQ